MKLENGLLAHKAKSVSSLKLNGESSMNSFYIEI